jgi:putative transposase
MNDRYPVVLLCGIAEVSRAGYYKWKATAAVRKRRRDQDADVKEHFLAIHQLRLFYGYLRMRTALRKEGIVVNHKRIRRLMRELGIRSIIRKKRPNVGRTPSVVFVNVLERDFKEQFLTPSLSPIPPTYRLAMISSICRR